MLEEEEASALIVCIISFIGTVALIGFAGEICLESSLPNMELRSVLLIFDV